MRPSHFVLILTASLMIACGTAQSVRSAPIRGCIRPTPTEASLSIRRARTSDTLLSRSYEGALAVQLIVPVETGAETDLRQVRLFRGDTVRADWIIASGVPTPAGWWSSRGVRPSVIYVQGRAIGYESVGEPVKLRSGYRDTVLIVLRRDIPCLVSSGSA